MRIGLDVSQTCAQRAGCAWYADGLSRALIAEGLPRGHSFELYHHFGSWINADTRGGTSVEDPRVTAPLRGLDPVAARKFWHEVETGEPLPGKPDVVLSFNFHAPRLPHSRLVYTVHDLAFWVHPEFATDETRVTCQRELLQALSRAAAFLFNSQHTLDEFELMLPAWLQLTERPTLVAHGASRFALASASAVPPETAPWLIVGSLEPRKNHAGALAAYELYHAHSTLRRPLVVAGGSGWKSDALHAKLADLQAAGLPVRYLGYVPDRALVDLYASSFALVCASWHEGFGLPVVEGLTAGLPVIASNRTSLPEVGGRAPAYFPPDQPAALAEAMLALERDPGARADRAAASLERGRAFSWARSAKSVLEFIERL